MSARIENDRFETVGCLQDYRIGEKLGSGSHGSIYHTCCDENEIEDINNCEYVTKEVKFNRYNNIRSFRQEVLLQKKAARHHLAPEIVKTEIKGTGGIFVMKKVYQTLYDHLLQNDDEDMADKIYSALTSLINLKIHHNDFHIRNIMMDKHYNVLLIDFGKSTTIEEGKSNECLNKDFDKLIDTVMSEELSVPKFLKRLIELHRSSFAFKPKNTKSRNKSVKRKSKNTKRKSKSTI